MPDAHANFAVSQVAAAPAPALSGLALSVQAGHGARFPATPFNAPVCPNGVLPTPLNAEIVRVSAIAGDVLTIARAQEGSSARSIVVGDQIVAAITAKTLADIETPLAGAIQRTGGKFACGIGSVTYPGASIQSNDIVIAHGLAGVPAWVGLTATGGYAVTDGPVFWVTSTDATNIHARCLLSRGGTPPSGVYGNFYWSAIL